MSCLAPSLRVVLNAGPRHPVSCTLHYSPSTSSQNYFPFRCRLLHSIHLVAMVLNGQASSQNPNFFALRSNGEILSVREQSENDNISQITEATNINDLPRISINSRFYVKEEHIFTKRARHSWVWQHGTCLLQLQDKEPYWSCNICDEKHHPILYSARTTANASRHLETKHQKYDPENADAPSADSSQQHVDNMFSFKRHKNSSSEIPKPLAERFKEAIIAWIVNYQIAFLVVENNFFRDLIYILSPSLAQLLPSGNTIRKWIIAKYEEEKGRIKREIREDSLSNIHISFDLWTSTNQMAMMAIVAHYTNQSFQVQTRLLALRRLYGTHSGENQAKLIIDVLKEYEITDKIGYFITDNASNNDTCIDIIVRTLLPTFTAEQRRQRRLRCWGHIINLAAKAFLFGKNPDDFDRAILVNRTLRDEQEELTEWRKCGPIGKLHNVIVAIRRSPQRRETFMELAEAGDEFSHLMVVQDNATRWNSAYHMIERALQKRTNIDKFIERTLYEKESVIANEDCLTDEDWLVLTKTKDILKPFSDQTKRLQSRASDGTHGAAWEAYPSCEFLLQHILAKKQEYEHDYEPDDDPENAEEVTWHRKHIRTCINNCWGKLDEYYQLLDDLPVYSAALALNPGQKLAFIETRWAHKPGWIRDAKKKIKKDWETLWKGRQTAATTTIPNPIHSIKYPSSSHCEPDAFEQFLNPPNFYTNQPTSSIDEYDEYLKIRAAKCEEPLAWWAGRREEWPNLFRMAMDILSIPLMSSECERIFSSAGWTLSDRRSGLKEDIIEATTCLRGWQ